MHTLCPQREGIAARTSQGPLGTASSQSSSPGYPARHLGIVCSGVTGIQIYEELGKEDIAISYQVIIRNLTAETHLRIAAYFVCLLTQSFLPLVDTDRAAAVSTRVPAAGLPVALSAIDERSFTHFLYSRPGGVVTSYFHPFRVRISFFTSDAMAFYSVAMTFCTLMTEHRRP